ncbi:hypothetical protein HOLleu_01945 [Holothuria leucospilota]|uniref:Uncharacterized protein n=1 Tax=Holothuria leucospilota TaxID=206669 RepID=A0A9Q1CR29_HOLLE|nr:hypothetical protein HOLleu_01945 [Holothuria leucospilota]
MEPKSKRFRQASILESMKCKTKDSAAAPTSGECTNEWKDNVAVAPENRQTPTIDFVDPYDPASFVGRRLSDDEKLSLLTSKFALPEGYKIEATGGRRLFWQI